MAQPTGYNTIFQGLGFPALAPETVLKNRMEKSNETFQKLINDQAQNLMPQDRGLFQSIAQIGNVLTQKGVRLDANEKRQFATMAKSNEYMRELQASDKWQEMDPQERAMATQDEIGRAALDMGDVGTFSTIATKTAQQRAAFKLNKAQQRSLDLGNDAKETSNEMAGLNLADAYNGKPGTFMLADEKGSFGFELGPDSARMVNGKVGRDGILRTDQGDAVEPGKYVTSGMYDTMYDNYTARIPKGTGLAKLARPATDLEKQTAFRQTLSTPWMRQQRDNYSAVKAQGRVAGAISETVDAMTAKGLDPNQLVGVAGDFTVGANRIFNGVKGTLGAFSTRVYDDKGQVVSEGVADGLKRYVDDITLPKGIHEGSIEASKYQAAVMQLVYTEANLNESGGRFSDQDIRNAMAGLGTSSGDLKAILGNLRQNFARRSQKITDAQKMARGIGHDPAFGFDDSRADTLLFGEDPGPILEQFNTDLGARQEAQVPESAQRERTQDSLSNPNIPNIDPRSAAGVAATKAKIHAL